MQIIPFSMQFQYSYAGMAKGGVSQNPPVAKKIGQPPCPVKPDPLRAG